MFIGLPSHYMYLLEAATGNYSRVLSHFLGLSKTSSLGDKIALFYTDERDSCPFKSKTA